VEIVNIFTDLAMFSLNEPVIFSSLDIPNGIDAVVRYAIKNDRYVIEMINIGSCFGTQLLVATSSELTSVK
jgi:hypothetical protein